MRNASPPETASIHSTSAEHQQHQHQPQQQQQKHSRQHQPPQLQQQHHHVHCSYDKDIACDDTQTHQQTHPPQLQHAHQQQQQQSQYDEQHLHQQQSAQCHTHAYGEHSQQQPQPQPTPTPHRHQQRKHSHSPHPSRHTSPHSHHSHSLHSSPHQSHHHVHEADSLPRSSHPPRPSTQSSSSHVHHHHNHRRRRRPHSHQQQNGGGGGSAGGSGNSSTHGPHGHSHQEQRLAARHHNHHGASCARRHRSATDVSSTSVNTCHDPMCVDREVQEILVRKSCCSASRTELAQYFAEDLYGSSRRPSSCCTSSDYCYQTDSTSLYGSRSSLSRNNSIKSASVAMRKRRVHQRQPSYTSISLRALNSSRPNSQGSLTSIFERAKHMSAVGGTTAGRDAAAGKMIVSPSKVTIERQTSKDALSNDLPEYACSPSPIRWSFLADGKSPTELEPTTNDGDTKDPWASDEQARDPKYECDHSRNERPEHRSATLHQRGRKQSHDDRPSTSAAARKCRDSPFSCEFEESTTVLFHQEGEAYNNCCSNYIQCNTYLDQDLQITSEDIHQYLSKGNQQMGDVLNNSKNYPFQPSNALEFQYKNNFANNNPGGTASSEGGDSVRGYEVCFRRNSSKETNLNQNSGGDPGICTAGAASGGSTGTAACAVSSCSSTPLSPTNINLSSSTNNINIVFGGYAERNANEVKFINTARENVVSTEAHHSGYLPYTYPSYDYTNMSANSLFDKPLGIGELPKDFANCGGGGIGGADGCVGCDAGDNGAAGSRAALESPPATGSDGQHSSLLQSPVQVGVSFESFDAPSDHNLISHRGSCQFSPSPRSPLSPASPASSCMSASINPAAASYVMNIHHPHFHYQHSERPQRQSPNARHHHSHAHAHAHGHNQYHHHHFTESFKFSNALKKVRKRARKYTDFLRKK